ncbi:sensor histidine kinase [Phreatobacter stygius]|uniref:sensor histidine kinase n=1 Tax=Phreatobacter stygius TaxID=1940610 RepID=UPI00147694A7|nr:ATP-binding protein [Phreatobacter stygius]
MAHYLAAFAAALAIPPLIFAAYVTYRYAWSEWQRFEAVAYQRNEDLVADLDRLLAARISLLQALATSPAIDNADFRRFDLQARQFVEQGIAIRMRDRTNQVVIDTARPLGAPLGKEPITARQQEVLEAKQPFITDLYTRQAEGQYAVGISVPVIRDGEVLYFLTTALSPAYLARFLGERGVEPPYYASIADRAGRVITRSTRHEESVGRALPGYERIRDAKGAWSGVNPEGVAVSAYYNRSELSGWFVTTGVDRQALEAPMRSLLWRLFALAAALLTLSVGTATFLAHRFSQASSALAGAADAVGTGQLAATPQTPISEINRIGAAFSRASVQLQEQAKALERANQDLELRVARRTGELAASEERHRLLADNSTDVILLRKASGPVTFASPSCLRLLGYSVAEMQTKLPDDLIHPDDLGRVLAINRAIGPANPSASSIHRLRHKDGHWIWVQSTYSFMAQVGPDRPNIMAVVRDDTERQLRELKLRHSNEALQQFSAIVSHDLQAPLRHINMFSDLLQARVGNQDAETTGYARRIMASVERMQRQIRSLLVYTQVAYATVKSEEVPLERVIAEATALLDTQVEEAGARIDLIDRPVLWGDPDLLVTLFQNLIANALKYRRDDPPVVTITAQASGQQWEISVEDKGLGIDPQYSERIFEIFRRLHRDESRYPGMGLGLALCRRIVESHDGQIWLDTGYSQGARFRLTLPRR